MKLPGRAPGLPLRMTSRAYSIHPHTHVMLNEAAGRTSRLRSEASRSCMIHPLSCNLFYQQYKEILLDYVRQAFQAAQLALRAIDETQFSTAERPQPMTEGIWSEGGSVGSAIFSHLLHDCQHYGMMESLISQQSSLG